MHYLWIVTFECIIMYDSVFMWSVFDNNEEETSVTLRRIHLYGDKKSHILANLNLLIRKSDVACRSELWMNKHTFDMLCLMVRDIGGLEELEICN